MVDAMPCCKVFRLEAGHSPFLTHPAQLAAVLSAAAQEIDR